MAWGIRTIVLLDAVSRATNFVPGFIFSSERFLPSGSRSRSTPGHGLAARSNERKSIALAALSK
jgi:hypothetical protein